MKESNAVFLKTVIAAAIVCTASSSMANSLPTPADVTPSIFSPGVISGPANDADPAFTSDGDTVYFARQSTIVVSHRKNGEWSTPEIAPFSGQWNDQQPTMSPDGRFLVFVSNRPVQDHDATHPAGNLWRVDWNGKTWSAPTHLPATINSDDSIWSPSVAGDGSLYFIKRPAKNAPFRIWRAQYRNGQYEAPVMQTFDTSMAQDVDPAVAPDESFIVFASMPAGSGQHERLRIAFRENGKWSVPIDLGDVVNTPGNETNEGRLAPDRQTLYYSSDRTQPVHFPRTREQAVTDMKRIESWDNGNQNIWSISLKPWLDGRKAL